MRVVIEVTETDQRVIARWFGDKGRATAEDVRKWAQSVINATLEDIG